MKFHPIGRTCITDPGRDFQFQFYWVVGRDNQFFENRKPRSGSVIQVCPIARYLSFFHEIPSDWEHLYNGSWTWISTPRKSTFFVTKLNFLKMKIRVQKHLRLPTQSSVRWGISMKFHPIGSTCITDPEREFRHPENQLSLLQNSTFRKWKFVFRNTYVSPLNHPSELLFPWNFTKLGTLV